MIRPALVVSLLLAFAVPARADEGMWLFNDFPSAQVQARYGLAPSQAWLNHVRRSSLKLGMGCSASFVSPHGLVMTNHHCVRDCLDALSAHEDLVARGFWAPTTAQERRCPNMDAYQLEAITDVTAEVNQATQGVQGPRFKRALEAEISRIESSCGTGPKVRCQVVTLFHGGKYQLYRYRRYQDLRIVFAPELQAAAFGGYPDNFNFPRFGYDVGFLRAYEDGRPVDSPDYLAWSDAGAKDGQLTFVSGNPGHTERGYTVAQLGFVRDVSLTTSLAIYSELQGILRQYVSESARHRSQATSLLEGIENSVKAYTGMHQGLADPALMGLKENEERALKAKVAQDPSRAAAVGPAWDQVAQALDYERVHYLAYFLVEETHGIDSELYRLARELVRVAAERTKPNDQRLPEYTDSHLPAVEQALILPAKVSKELEEETLSASLKKIPELLGPDDPLTAQVLGRDSPENLARALVTKTRMDDAKFRQALYQGGWKAVSTAQDPMIQFALKLDAPSRAVRKAFEDHGVSIVNQQTELIARARIALEPPTYPDATFTLRLSYGKVQGWQKGDRGIDPFTTFGGMYEHATGKPPFDLPKSWAAAKSRLDPTLHFNMVTTNDIVGGNSGSPVLDQAGKVVGIAFDGNLPSLVGSYLYRGEDNRTVVLCSQAILEGLDKVYPAHRLADEIRHGTGP